MYCLFRGSPHVWQKYKKNCKSWAFPKVPQVLQGAKYFTCQVLDGEPGSIILRFTLVFLPIFAVLSNISPFCTLQEWDYVIRTNLDAGMGSVWIGQLFAWVYPVIGPQHALTEQTRQQFAVSIFIRTANYVFQMPKSFGSVVSRFRDTTDLVLWITTCNTNDYERIKSWQNMVLLWFQQCYIHVSIHWTVCPISLFWVIYQFKSLFASLMWSFRMLQVLRLKNVCKLCVVPQI